MLENESPNTISKILGTDNENLKLGMKNEIEN